MTNARAPDTNSIKNTGMHSINPSKYFFFINTGRIKEGLENVKIFTIKFITLLLFLCRYHEPAPSEGDILVIPLWYKNKSKQP